MQFTLCTSLYALHSMHFTLCTSLYALHSMHFTLCASLYALHSMHFTLCTSLYALHSMHFSLCCCVRGLRTEEPFAMLSGKMCVCMFIDIMFFISEDARCNGLMPAISVWAVSLSDCLHLICEESTSSLRTAGQMSSGCTLPLRCKRDCTR